MLLPGRIAGSERGTQLPVVQPDGETFKTGERVLADQQGQRVTH
jgi:hypothetical protein